MVHNDELYSSYGLARGATPNSELKHWKYIKRVKGKNGKWRYYYDKSQNTAARLTDKRKQQWEIINKYDKMQDGKENHIFDTLMKSIGRSNATSAEYGRYKDNNKIKFAIEMCIDKHAKKTVNKLNNISEKIYKAKNWLKNLFKK